MQAQEIEINTEAGEWVTLNRAAGIFGVGERTIQNRIKSGVHPAKVEEGKTLVFVKSSILDVAGSEEVDTLRKELEQERESHAQERERHAELRGEMKGLQVALLAKDEVIRAKEQAINAANAAIMIQEKSIPAIQAGQTHWMDRIRQLFSS